MPYKNLCYISSLALTATVDVVVVVPSVAVEFSHTYVRMYFICFKGRCCCHCAFVCCAVLCSTLCAAEERLRLPNEQTDRQTDGLTDSYSCFIAGI